MLLLLLQAVVVPAPTTSEYGQILNAVVTVGGLVTMLLGLALANRLYKFKDELDQRYVQKGELAELKVREELEHAAIRREIDIALRNER